MHRRRVGETGSGRGWSSATWVGVFGLMLVARPALAGAPSVLFDEAHGQKFRIEAQDKLDLSKLADSFRAVGAQVRSSQKPLSSASLEGVDVLVISGPFAPLGSEELPLINGFVQRGGSLAIMLHIPFPLTPLLRQLHVDFSNGVIRERQHISGADPLNFQVTALTPHALTRHLDSFAVVGAWALLNEDPTSTIVARTSDSAWVDLNNDGKLETLDAVQSFALVVAGQMGEGRFVVFGDDAIFQNEFLSGGNATLAHNLACWLTKLPCK